MIADALGVSFLANDDTMAGNFSKIHDDVHKQNPSESFQEGNNLFYDISV